MARRDSGPYSILDVPLPADYLEPKWDEYNRVHNWRNYVSDELQAMWNTFTEPQRAALARSFERVASDEDWD